ncbi:glutathione S-transferase-like protein [Pleurotus eryngii]|uniref:glutathione transferase n=1 Tax=Pleurotus eryngii TaxID=5323 RepID=A0A9P6DBX4_PLEER|nr:glutathione S-transferase-like protein [Pleurotus eryngii]
MVLKLYGSPISTCTKRVVNVLIELNVPFELVPIDMRKEDLKAPQYLEKHPFGKVPYIDDDGFILYESRAISRYLATKYSGQGTQLIPKDLQAWARFEQAASVEVCNFEPYASGVVFEKYYKPMLGQAPDEERVKGLTEKLNASLDAYDLILSKQKFLGGDELTLADLFHLPLGSLLPLLGVNAIQERPNVKRWFEAISSRPSWQAAEKSTA